MRLGPGCYAAAMADDDTKHARISAEGDPTGLIEAGQSIREGQLSTRQQRIAHGLALQAAGHSWREAGRLSGVPWSTLYHAKRTPGIKRRDDIANGAERDIVASQMAISLEASTLVMQRLPDMKDSNLINAMKTATIAVSSARDWRRGAPSSAQADAGMSTLAQMLQGKRVTIEDAPEAPEPIDVTPEPDDSA